MMVTIEISTWRARAWIVAMRLVSPIVGRSRAERWAWRGSCRFLRWRVAGGRWMHSDPPHVCPFEAVP